ncbi:MAG TPA: ABC transporter permease [Nocardioidaceae bacterium]|nr:ABC transporter permease [Nocardioidaceae bacterium]
MNVMTLLKKAVLLVALPVVLLGVWWVTTANSTDPYVPPLREVFETFPDTWTADRLMNDMVPSIVRLLVGYAVAVLLGVALGVAVGSSRTLRNILEPVLEFFRAIPPPVLIPIVILFAGIGHTMKVIVIVSGCIWPVLLNTVEGVRAVDDVLRDTSRCYGIGGTSRLRYLTLRSASPQILAGMRQALSLAIILMVISEMFAASNGLGFTVVQFQRSFAIPEMYTGIIVLGLVGIALSLLFGLLERRALAWYFGLRRSQRGE